MTAILPTIAGAVIGIEIEHYYRKAPLLPWLLLLSDRFFAVESEIPRSKLIFHRCRNEIPDAIQFILSLG
jgi:hypothetical protein